MPIAPTVARMVLQAHAEGALPEVLVIAAAISVQDPRERPAEQEAEADRMHRQFVDPRSDFLTLYNIWMAYCDRLEQGTQSQMRKFCRQHFLSFAQILADVLNAIRGDLGNVHQAIFARQNKFNTFTKKFNQ